MVPELAVTTSSIATKIQPPLGNRHGDGSRQRLLQLGCWGVIFVFFKITFLLIMKQSRAGKKNPQTSAEKGKIKVTQNAQGQGRNSVLDCDYSVFPGNTN